MLVAEDFECNVCFDLARDPIVTLCGHLYCWPCLYRWLHHHSSSQQCPVCKALIQEDKLEPLYKTQADDPRSGSYPGITHTPPRPETAQPPAPDNAPGFHQGFHNFHGGHANWFPPRSNRANRTDYALKSLLLLIGFFVILTIVFV